MSNITDTYVNALLADATYALDSDVSDGITGDTLAGELKTRMTLPLAEYIGSNFTVVTHKDTSDIFGSGFDATVWRDNTGKTYVSTTDSTPDADFAMDIDLEQVAA